MAVEILLCVSVVYMLIAALIAIEARDLLSSVIALGAAGFALSIVDLLLGAPDLALTQVVFEVIALVLLVRLVVTRRDESASAEQGSLRTSAGLLAGGVILAGAFVGVMGFGDQSGTLPPFGEPVLSHEADAEVPPGVGKDYLEGAAEETGAANAVAAVLLDYRAYDTLGEATVIFTAVMGTYALLRHRGRKGAGT